MQTRQDVQENYVFLEETKLAICTQSVSIGTWHQPSVRALYTVLLYNIDSV